MVNSRLFVSHSHPNHAIFVGYVFGIALSCNGIGMELISLLYLFRQNEMVIYSWLVHRKGTDN